jgi:hypothetical protein
VELYLLRRLRRSSRGEGAARFPGGGHEAAVEVQELQGRPGNCRGRGWDGMGCLFQNVVVAFGASRVRCDVLKAVSDPGLHRVPVDLTAGPDPGHSSLPPPVVKTQTSPRGRGWGRDGPGRVLPCSVAPVPGGCRVPWLALPPPAVPPKPPRSRSISPAASSRWPQGRRICRQTSGSGIPDLPGAFQDSPGSRFARIIRGTTGPDTPAAIIRVVVMAREPRCIFCTPASGKLRI